jgi:REP element-mobilizing transposase RayT
VSIHTPITNTGIYFITFTNHAWLPLIQLTGGYDLVYKWFDILKENGHAVTGFVIMPNHLHVLLYYNRSRQTLNTMIGNGKRFMAYAIIDRLIKTGQEEIIARLRKDVRVKDKDRGKIHEVWKDSFDVKECRTEKFIMQKLNYIHNNPCSGKWKLAVDPIHYLHSSASFYISGKKGTYEIRDYREFMNFEVED